MSATNGMAGTLTRGKRIVLIVLGVVLAILGLEGAGFVITGWSSDLDGGAHQFHHVMRGASTVPSLLAALVLIIRPSWALGAAKKLAANGIAYPIAAIVSLTVWPPAIIYPIIALVVVGVVYWAYRGNFPWNKHDFRLSFSRPLLALTVVVAVPLIVYGLNEASLQRSTEALHGDLGHWAGSLAGALTIVILMLFASMRMPGWRVPAWSAGFMLFMLGVASVLMPNQASSVGEGWGTLAIISSVAFLGVAELEPRLFGRVAPQPAGS